MYSFQSLSLSRRQAIVVISFGFLILMLNSSPEGVIFHQVYNVDKALLQLLETSTFDRTYWFNFDVRRFKIALTDWLVLYKLNIPWSSRDVSDPKTFIRPPIMHGRWATKYSTLRCTSWIEFVRLEIWDLILLHTNELSNMLINYCPCPRMSTNGWLCLPIFKHSI